MRRARRPHPHWLAWAVILTAAFLCVGPAPSAQAQDGFTAAERQRLEDGELVVRPMTERRGALRLIGGSSWQVVERSLAATWRALCDSRSYTQMLPAAQSTEVVAHAPGERVVRVSHAVGFLSASYHLRMAYDHDGYDIAFNLDDARPNDLRAAWGFISIAPYEGDPERTLVSYGVMADVGGGMFGSLVRGEIHEWMLRVPSTIRSYLQGSARHRFEG